MNPINNEIIFHVAIACLEMAEKVVLMDRRLEFEYERPSETEQSGFRQDHNVEHYQIH